MIRSMTGYGRGECVRHDRRFKVEIKSVNHRYSDIAIKLPRFLNPFEDNLRKRLAKDIQRGKADVYVSFETFTSRDVSVSVNMAFADAYEQALHRLKERYGLDDPVTLAMLSSHPDILTVERNPPDASAQTEIWETLSEALEQAITGYNAMRESEGLALHKDLIRKNEAIRQLVTQIRERAPLVAQEYAQKLRERMDEILEKAGLKVEEARFLTEVAVFADRSSIDEELTRLDSHLIQMGEILDQSGSSVQTAAVGRKLDFLVQEINREANTIGSKANDAVLTRLVVDLKSEVEKIREQVQNIE